MFLTNIIQYFEKTVQQHPDRVAIYDGDRAVSFQELYELSVSIGHAASELTHSRINNIIAVYLPKCADAVASDIAVNVSGNAYMNLDVKHPEQRIRNILELVKPAAIISMGDAAKKISTWADGIPVINLDSLPTVDIPAASTALQSLRTTVIDTDPYCVITTSGSTGTPKAVILNHRSFIDFTETATLAGIVPNPQCIASLSPMVFDIFSFELCLLMSKASSILVIPDTLAAFPVRILEMMQKHAADFIFWVPTIMVNIANMGLLSEIALPELRTVWFAGEVFPTAKFNYWRQRLPQAMFVNLYGPIEITLDCTYYIASRPLRDEEPIPIGVPFPNTDILLLNTDNHLVQGDEEGEICVRGSSLAMGYYNNPEKTAAAFVQNPLNSSYPELIYRTGDIGYRNEYGEIVFKGRKDTLIKHMGYRIELAEIENVIAASMPHVKNCCALYNAPVKRITLFYEAEQSLADRDMRMEIGKILPHYMVPSVYIHVAEMPRNTNGKIDRLLLAGQMEH